MQRRLTIILPADELKEVVGLVDRDCVEVVGVDAHGLICLLSENPQAFFRARSFVAAATWSEASVERLMLARKQIEDYGGACLPEILLLEGKKDLAAVHSLTTYALCELLERGAEEAQTRREQWQVLRTRADTLQDELTDWSRLGSRLGLKRIEQCFVSSPNGAFPTQTSGCISQTLPVSGAQFCGFELHLASVDDEPIWLKLWNCEEDIMIASWAPSASRLQEGWNRFALPRALDGSAQSLRLEIGGNPLSRLSVGQAIPDGTYQVEAAGAPVADKMLALRLYACLPGAENEFGGELRTNIAADLA
jgi:hypothetical protein